MKDDVDWVSNVLWTDEVHFSLSGSVNTQNCRIRAKENLHAFGKKTLRDLKGTVWCGYTATFVIGPLFSDEICGNRFQTVSRTNEHSALLFKVLLCHNGFAARIISVQIFFFS